MYSCDCCAVVCTLENHCNNSFYHITFHDTKEDKFTNENSYDPIPKY